MDRISKFRAKRKLNGKWVYGSLISIGNDWCQIVPEGTEYDDIANSMITVISHTIGEFSGLFDKNKKEIYEGDIVLDGWDETTRGLVDFDTGWFNLHIGYIENIIIQSQDCMVIGNIHDDPELIN